MFVGAERSGLRARAHGRERSNSATKAAGLFRPFGGSGQALGFGVGLGIEASRRVAALGFRCSAWGASGDLALLQTPANFGVTGWRDKPCNAPNRTAKTLNSVTTEC